MKCQANHGFVADTLTRNTLHKHVTMPTICLIPGDGVGREVIPAAARVLATVCPDLTFTAADAGWDCFQRQGTALPPETLAAVAAADATLFGATQSPPGGAPGYASPILSLRRHFDLYANLRPAASLLPGQPAVDLLIVRENSEGLYSGREREQGDTAIAERVISRSASERIARVACEQARRRRRRLTIVHKANVLKKSDGLFRQACLHVAAGYPDLVVDELLVDAAAMWLVKHPARFDVIVTTNLFGDILSDLTAGLVGGLGVTASANVGAGRVAVFEPVHGSAPDIAGQGVANPLAAILSTALLLEHMGRASEAGRVRQAVRATIEAGLFTPDLGGSTTTMAVTEAICHRLAVNGDQVAVVGEQYAETGIETLRRLVEIPSVSGEEGTAVAYLVGWMAAHGFEQAFIDAAGNAVGLRDGGPTADGSAPRDIVLLGHIDTVPGEIAVRVQEGKLFGRGTVDAKGALAAFAVAAAQVQPPPGWRIIVIGAVEEEAATSKGARFAAEQYRPVMCIIGEPSGCSRVTLGYKGRLLAEISLRQAMAHTAGPQVGVCEQAVAVWQRVQRRVEEINAGRERAWDQVLPSIRGMGSGSDGLEDWATLRLGFRLPEDVPPASLQALIRAQAGSADVRFEGAAWAWRAEKNTPLVRAFLAAIRDQGERPGFVLKTGTSDMNVVGPIWQCPIVAYGPGDSRLDHTPGEHVHIVEWERGVAVLAAVLAKVTAGG